MLSAMMAAAALLAAEAPVAPPPAQPSAPETTASPATVTAPPKAGTLETDKTVCRNEPIMGSRMTGKVCSSAAERARALQDEREQLEHLQVRK